VYNYTTNITLAELVLFDAEAIPHFLPDTENESETAGREIIKGQ
jgi:hypothetical protein